MFLNATSDAGKKFLKKISRVCVEAYFLALLKTVLLLVNIFFTDLNYRRSNLSLDI